MATSNTFIIQYISFQAGHNAFLANALMAEHASRSCSITTASVRQGTLATTAMIVSSGSFYRLVTQLAVMENMDITPNGCM